MSSIFLAVIARLSIRELNKENVHCVSYTLNLAVSKCEQNIFQFTFYDCTLCLWYKMVVSVERIDVCLDLLESNI